MSEHADIFFVILFRDCKIDAQRCNGTIFAEQYRHNKQTILAYVNNI